MKMLIKFLSSNQKETHKIEQIKLIQLETQKKVCKRENWQIDQNKSFPQIAPKQNQLATKMLSRLKLKFNKNCPNKNQNWIKIVQK